MGRRTYEKVLTFDRWPHDSKQVIVMSTTLETGDSRITIARTLEDAVQRLDGLEPNRSTSMAARSSRHFSADLIDEISIGWAPVLIGSGLPLFGALVTDVQLSLVASNASSGGMVHATYRVYRGESGPDQAK